MKCDEFLALFKDALDAKVPDQIINDNVTYYRSYINSEVRKGRSEEEVINSLGNPRLLAKTIEESTKFAEGAEESYYEYGNDNASTVGNQNIKLPIWLVKIIVVIVVIFLLVVVFRVAYFLAPYILLLLIVTLAVREIRNWISRN
jgi:uncharacterized membrane protein